MMILIEQLQAHEGFKSDFFFRHFSSQVIGYGRKASNRTFSSVELLMLGREDFNDKPMTKEEAEMLLVNDVKAIIALLEVRIPWYKLSPARKATCVNMSYSIGVDKFLNQTALIDALNDGDYLQAAAELLNTRWADTVGTRAEDLALQLNSGSWQ